MIDIERPPKTKIEENAENKIVRNEVNKKRLTELQGVRLMSKK